LNRLLTLDQVADELGCSISTVKRRVRHGVLPVFKDDGIVRVREADLRRYVIERVKRLQPGRPAIAGGYELPPGDRLWD
jgi:excisionase family DNA binding protein